MSRICFLVSDPFKVGGIQRYIKDLIVALKELGVSPRLVIRERSWSMLGYFLRSLLLGISSKIVWCGHINFAVIGWLLSWVGKRYVVFTYGIDVWNMSKFQKMLLIRAYRVVTISSFTKQKLIEQEPRLNEKIFLLPPTVLEAVFQPSGNKIYLSELGIKTENIILTTSRLDKRERYKGYDRVIKALPLILKKIPDAHYLLVGGDGGDIPAIESLASELKVENNLTIVTDVSQEKMVRYYGASKVFVMPSSGEGFGIVFLEAIASGKLAIGGNADGSVDPLGNGDLGILVDPFNIEEIAEVISNCLQGSIPLHLKDAAAVRERMLNSFGNLAYKRRVQELLSETLSAA